MDLRYTLASYLTSKQNVYQKVKSFGRCLCLADSNLQLSTICLRSSFLNNIYIKTRASLTYVSAWPTQNFNLTSKYLRPSYLQSSLKNRHGPVVSVCLYLDFKTVLDISSTFCSSGSKAAWWTAMACWFMSVSTWIYFLLLWHFKIYRYWRLWDQLSALCSSVPSESTDIDDYGIHFLLFRLSVLHRRQLCKCSYISPLSKTFEWTHYVWVLAFAPLWSLWQSWMRVSHGLLLFSIQSHQGLAHVCFSALGLFKMEFLFLDVWFSVLSSQKNSDTIDDVWVSVLGSKEKSYYYNVRFLPSPLKNGRLQPDVEFSALVSQR